MLLKTVKFAGSQTAISTVLIKGIGNGSNVSVKVAVDGLLSESRQQQLALKTVLAQLGLGKAFEKASGEKSALAQWLDARSG